MIRSGKPLKTSEDRYRVIIEPQDIHTVPVQTAANDPFVWTALAWGSWRDLELLKRLSRNPNLEKYKAEKKIHTGEGIIRGTKPKRYSWTVGRRIQEGREFPAQTFMYLKPGLLPINENPRAHRPPRKEIFKSPQLLIKQSWLVGPGRFQASLVDAPPGDEGVLCSDSYVTVHAPTERREILEAAWLAQNSKWATYYQLLTSGRFGAFLPQPLEDELRSLPLPEPCPGLLDGIKTIADVDNRIRELLGFKESEWTLIEDLFEFTLPDFKGDARSPGRLPTLRKPYGQKSRVDSDLQGYAEQFIRVLKAGFGSEKEICATIFQEPLSERLPVRLLAIHLHWPSRKPVEIEATDSEVLLQRLAKLYAECMTAPDNESGFHFERSVRIYAPHPTSKGKVPTVFLVKPDQRRQWTRSMAMRDADEVAAEIMQAKWKR